MKQGLKMVNMLSFIISQIFIVFSFYFLSMIPKKMNLKLLFVGIATVEFALIPAFFYFVEAGGNILPLLRINFWIITLIIVGFGTLTLYYHFLEEVSTITLTDSEERFKRR